MRHLSLHRFQLLCVALVIGLFAPMISASPTNAPFHATILFSEQVAPIGSPPCFLVGTISGTGVATSLGAVMLASTDCINPLPPTFTSYAFSSSHVVLTAVNGDQVWATYYGFLSPEGVITGAYVIYGGTGRNANATGSGTLQGFETIDPATGAGTGQIQLTGTLSH
ncbi:MAG: hypothetical protein E6H67_16260 [Betaproteobacteria bacterium]|nr:MAG: hypothetical protein E6H67_16260 [Betaproteobacteria bacterium]